MDNEKLLKKWRDDIDHIDNDIHDLIMQRWDAVQNIAAAKNKTVGLPIRPMREYDILCRLYHRHHIPLSFMSVVNIWYDLISAYTQAQINYKIGVLMVNDNCHHIWDITRTQFGSCTTTYAYDHVDNLKAAYHHHDIDIMIIPATCANDIFDICSLKTDIPLYVFSSLPNISYDKSDPILAYAIGKVAVEKNNQMMQLYFNCENNQLVIYPNKENNSDNNIFLGAFPPVLVIDK